MVKKNPLKKVGKNKDLEILRTTAISEDVRSISDLLLSPEQAQFIAAYVTNNYNIQAASRVSRILPNKFYEWKHNYPHFAKAIELCKDQYIDMIEDAFKDLIIERNPQAVIFGLRTLGKERGYGENLKLENDITIKGIDIQVLPSRPALEDKNENSVSNQ